MLETYYIDIDTDTDRNAAIDMDVSVYIDVGMCSVVPYVALL